MTAHRSTRSRSVILDSAKIRNLANENGLRSWIHFESSIAEIFGSNSTTAKNLWHGKKVDKCRATEVAAFFGLSSYADLLPEICQDMIFPKEMKWDIRYAPSGSLLNPDYKIVPFHRRHSELEAFDAWCSDASDLAIRLCTGSWGIGKTRLAIEQCERLSKNNKWVSGFLSQKEVRNVTTSRFSTMSNTTKPVFIVVDSSETRREEIVELLKFALSSKIKLRILLIARATGDWWDMLRTESDGVGELLSSRATSQLKLSPLCLNERQKAESFFLAADSFARTLKCEAPFQAPVKINEKYFDCSLILHMQALMSLEKQQARSYELNAPRVVLNRERLMWEKRANDLMLPKGLHKAIGEVMVKITGIGGVKSKQQATKVMNSIQILSDCKTHEKETVMKLLHGLYPANDDSTSISEGTSCSNYIEPFQKEFIEELNAIL